MLREIDKKLKKSVERYEEILNLPNVPGTRREKELKLTEIRDAQDYLLDLRIKEMEKRELQDLETQFV